MDDEEKAMLPLIPINFLAPEWLDKWGFEMENTTDVGFVNRNNQKNLGKRLPPLEGTDYGQYVYVMNCTECGFV